VFSHTRIKNFKNKILNKFNNPEWKQNQYYVTNFLIHKKIRPYLNRYGIVILLTTKDFKFSFKWFLYFPKSLQKRQNSCQEQNVTDRFKNRDWL